MFQYVIEQDQNEARRRCSAHCSNLNFGSSACNVIWIKEETLGTVYQCTLVSLDSLNDLDGMVVKKTDPGSTEVLLLNLVDALHNEIVEWRKRTTFSYTEQAFYLQKPVTIVQRDEWLENW